MDINGCLVQLGVFLALIFGGLLFAVPVIEDTTTSDVVVDETLTSVPADTLTAISTVTIEFTVTASPTAQTAMTMTARPSATIPTLIPTNTIQVSNSPTAGPSPSSTSTIAPITDTYTPLPPTRTPAPPTGSPLPPSLTPAPPTDTPPPTNTPIPPPTDEPPTTNVPPPTPDNSDGGE